MLKLHFFEPLDPFDTFTHIMMQTKSDNVVRTKLILYFFSIVTLAFACNSGEKEGDCATTPSAIFSEDLIGVFSHDFMQTGTESLEIISFQDGVFLEVFQSGCDSLRQEFRFRLPDPEENDDPQFWLKEASDQFRMLGSLGPEYQPFFQYADVLAQQEESFRLSKPMEVDAGFWMQIDKIQSFDGPTLVIILANFEL